MHVIIDAEHKHHNGAQHKKSEQKMLEVSYDINRTFSEFLQ